MAGVEYDDFEDDLVYGIRSTLQGVVNWSGAIMSIALVLGLTIWAYRLAVRDVTGVPVVRALEGPMRVVPDDPGGRQADHQGLAVNEVTAEGEAAGPVDRLLLAPRPVDLTEEDAPGAALRREASLVAIDPPRAEAGEPAPQNAESLQNAYAAEPMETPDPVAEALALAEEITQGATPFAVEPDVAETPQGVAEGAPGLARSLRPRPRPEADLAAQAAIAAATASVARATPQETDGSALVPGTNLVQLGAFDSPDVARAEWQRLTARFASFMAGKTRVVQSAVSGGRTFYRLRAAGFSDISDARRFCAALTAENADCIPVVAR